MVSSGKTTQPACKHFLSTGTSLAIQWLRLHTSNAGATGSIPGQGTKTTYAMDVAKKNITAATTTNNNKTTGLFKMVNVMICELCLRNTEQTS